MYRCRIIYDEWKCILSKSRIARTVDMPEFSGYIGLIKIHKVDRPQIWKYNGEDLIVCDDNFQWLTIMPKDDFYCITVMMNGNGEIQVCYIDMIAEQGYDEDGVPYFYDLYLDLVVYPDGTIVEDDMDELQMAFAECNITRKQFDLAIDTCNKLKNGLLNDMTSFKAFIQRMYEVVMENNSN